MSTNIGGKLEHRNYVVHVFTGILLNVFLLAALFPALPDRWWEYDLPNEIIISLIAIPILFLEGHFLLAIDRLLFIEIPIMVFLHQKQEIGFCIGPTEQKSIQGRKGKTI